MKNIIIAIILASVAATASCSILKDTKVDAARTDKPDQIKTEKVRPEIKKPSVGDAVVARWGPALFAAGRVDSIDNERKEAKIVWDHESSPSDVDIADVFPLPKTGDAVSLRPGDFTLVKSQVDQWWTGAEIREVSGNVIKARVVNGGEIVNLPPEKVLNVSEVVAADIKEQADRDDFLNKAYEHRPAVPAGYIPKVGDHVLGEWTTNAWFGGKVRSVSDGKATIIWENGMKPDDAPFEKIIPYPTAANNDSSPVAGDYVLVKPSNGNPKAAWIYALVTGINDLGIEAKSDESTREHKTGDFVVLQK
jgi:hypothetical protein